MAKSFNITAQINMASPTNLKAIRQSIQKGLSGLSVPVKFTIPRNLGSSIASLNKTIPTFSRNLRALTTAGTNAATAINALTTAVGSLKATTVGGGLASTTRGLTNVSRASVLASKDIQDFGLQAGIALRRFSAFAVAAGSLVSAIQLIRDGFRQAISFQNEMVRLSQVTGQSLKSIQGVGNTIGELSTTLGVSSEELSKVAVTLAQAGFSAKETSTALSTLARTDLAPTFDDLESTTEGLIAVFRQFNLQAYEIEGAFGAINAVAAAYAVESKDIIEATKRAGGVFSAVGGNLNEFIALFSAVRDTTRLSSETIATGLNTILTRLERPKTLEFLKSLGINLLDTKGQFIGAFDSIQKLGEAIGTLSASDPRLIQISEYLAGYRQLKVIIPLIQQTAKEQEALRIAQLGSNSLSKDSISAQQSLIRQFTKLKEEFLSLVRAITNDDVFRGFVQLMLDASRAAIQLADSLRPIIPLLAAVGTIKTIQFGAKVVSGARSGRTFLNSGGPVPGRGDRDSVPAMLTPGEFVIRKRAAQQIGYDKLDEINETGRVKFASGGVVGRVANLGRRAQVFKEGHNNDSIDEIVTDISAYQGAGVGIEKFLRTHTNGFTYDSFYMSKGDFDLFLRGQKKKSDLQKSKKNNIDKDFVGLSNTIKLANRYRTSSNLLLFRALSRFNIEDFSKLIGIDAISPSGQLTEEAASKLIGKTFRTREFLSTSLSNDVAERFNRRGLLQLFAPEKSNLISPQFFTRLPSEYEILIPPKSEIGITGYKKQRTAFFTRGEEPEQSYDTVRLFGQILGRGKNRPLGLARGGKIGVRQFRDLVIGARDKNALLQYPSALLSRLVRLIPAGSQFLGAGIEAAGFRLPNKNVLRLGAGRVKRPQIEGVLQPINTKYLSQDQFTATAEEVPFAPNFDYYRSRAKKILRPNDYNDFVEDTLIPIFRRGALEVEGVIYNQGYLANDVHLNNVGVTQSGKNRKFVLTDPGFLAKFPDVDTEAATEQLSKLSEGEAKALRSFERKFGIKSPKSSSQNKALVNQVKFLNALQNNRLAGGGAVDSVPAMLTPGEFVIRKEAARAIGAHGLHKLNHIDRFNRGGPVKRYAGGTSVVGQILGGFYQPNRTIELGAFNATEQQMESLRQALLQYEQALDPNITQAQQVARATKTLDGLLTQYGTKLKLNINKDTGEVVGVDPLNKSLNRANRRNRARNLFGFLGPFGSAPFLVGTGLNILGSKIREGNRASFGQENVNTQIFGEAVSGLGTGLAASSFIGGGPVVAGATAVAVSLASIARAINDVPIEIALNNAVKSLDKFNEKTQDYLNLQFDNTPEGLQESKQFAELFKVQFQASNISQQLDTIGKLSSESTFLESTGRTFDVALNSLLGGFSGGESFNLFGPSDRELEARGKEARRKAAAELAGPLLQRFDKQAQEAAARGELKGSREENIGTLRELLGVTEGQARDLGFQSQEQLLKRVLAGANKAILDEEIKAYDKRIQEAKRGFSAVLDVVSAFTAQIRENAYGVEASFDLIDATANGSILVGKPRIDTLNNLGGASPAAIQQVQAQLGALGAGEGINAFLSDVANIQQNLPRVLREAGDIDALGNQADISEFVNNSIDALNLNNKNLVTLFKDEFNKRIAVTANDKGETQIQQILNSRNGFADFVNEVLASTDIDASREGFADALQQEYDIKLQQVKVTEALIKSQEDYRKSLIAIDAATLDRDSLINQFAGGRGLLRDNSLANSLGRLGFNGSVQDIGNSLNINRAALNDARQDRDVQEQTQYFQAVSKATEALQLIADVGRNTATSLDNLSKVSARRQSKEDVARSFFGSDAQGRIDLLRQANLLNSARQAGTLDVFSIQQQQEIVNALSGPLGKLPGLPQDFFAQLVGNSSGIGGIIGKSILGDVDEEKAIQQEIIATYNRAIEAQQILAEDINTLTSALSTTAQDELTSALGSLTASIQRLEDTFRELYIGRSSGGPIYANRGFRPRGTDTVPAIAGTQPFMLTPGEFIINKRSSQKYAPLLDAINRDTLYAQKGYTGSFKGNVNAPDEIKKIFFNSLKNFEKIYPRIDFSQLEDFIVEPLTNLPDTLGIYRAKYKNIAPSSRGITLNANTLDRSTSAIRRTIEHELGHYVDDYLGKFKTATSEITTLDELSQLFGSNNIPLAKQIADKFGANRKSIADSKIGLTREFRPILNPKSYPTSIIQNIENFADAFAYSSYIPKNASRAQRAEIKDFRNLISQLFQPTNIQSKLINNQKLLSRKNIPLQPQVDFYNYAPSRKTDFATRQRAFNQGRINGRVGGKLRLSKYVRPGIINTVGNSLGLVGGLAAVGEGLSQLNTESLPQDATLNRVGAGLNILGGGLQSYVSTEALLGSRAALTAVGGVGTSVGIPAVIAGLAGSYGLNKYADTLEQIGESRSGPNPYAQFLEARAIREIEDEQFQSRLAQEQADFERQQAPKRLYTEGYRAFGKEYGRRRRERDVANLRKETETLYPQRPSKNYGVGQEQARINLEATQNKIAAQKAIDEQNKASGNARRQTALDDLDELIKRANALPNYYYGGSARDSTTARLTQGEYVINARSSRKYRDLIQGINSDTLYRASGGTTSAKLRERKEQERKAIQRRVEQERTAKEQAYADRQAKRDADRQSLLASRAQRQADIRNARSNAGSREEFKAIYQAARNGGPIPGVKRAGGTIGGTPSAPNAPTRFDIKNGQSPSTSGGGFDTRALQDVIKQFNDTLAQFRGLSIELKVQDIKIDLTGAEILSKLEPALRGVIGNAIINHINANLVVPGQQPVPPMDQGK